MYFGSLKTRRRRQSFLNFSKNEDKNVSKRIDERKSGKMEKRICQKSEENNDEDGFGSTHFGSGEEGI